MNRLFQLPRHARTFARYYLARRAVDYPAPETELGIVPLGFELSSYLETLHGYADRYHIEVLHRARYQGREHPSLVLRSRGGEGRCVLVLAGVHGNEHAGLLAVPQILDRLAGGPLRLVVITPVNPVGAAELSRYNADGFDINRDFVRFATAEARAVRDVMERERPDFVVSLHEGPQDATFLFANRHVDRGLAERLLDRLEAGGTELATRDYFGRALLRRGLFPVTGAAWVLTALWARALAMMSTGGYCDARGTPEITLESSWRGGDRAARIRPHVDLVEELGRYLTSSSSGL